jgi:hypothetical protein
MIRPLYASVTVLSVLVLAACGSSDGSGVGAGTGGTDGGGPGGTTGGSGGKKSSGGSGGASSGGASTSTGGATSAGGAVSTGGTSADTGGTTASGGTDTGAGGTTPDAGTPDSSTTVPDASSTGGTTSTGGATSTGGTTSTGGAGGGCGPDNTACSFTGGVSGFCKAGACVACNGKADNASCSAAYGSGAGYVCSAGNCVAGDCLVNADCTGGELCGISTANQCGACSADAQCTGTQGYGAGYLCIGGACVQANCRTDANCGAGQICGVKTPNNCGACSTDAQCQADATYGAADICDTTQGKCVTAACTPNNTKCAANGADFCCAASCVPGNCCQTSDCATLGNNYTCVAHTCSLCPQATANTFYVDPVGGSDTVGTGSNTSAACAFKTITRALAFIGAAPNANTQVLVLTTGPLGTATNGETFPISVPHNVTISGSGGRAQINVPATTAGFILNHTASGLSALTIDGQTQTASVGISVTTGADATTQISHLAVQNFGRDGVRVQGTGGLTIGAGTSSTGNGTAAQTADGLHILDQGAAFINVTSGDAVHFNSNSAHGIMVTGSGSVTITGTPGTGGNGTVTANENQLAGVWIEQTPGGTAPNNAITGLVAWANVGNGARFVGGSSVKLRSSLLLANQGSGVIVSTYTAAALRSNDVSKIDLGTAGGTASPGGSTVQASLGSNPNLGAGICLELDRLAGSTLNAAGNIFAGPTNCASSTATLTRNNTCSGAVDVSVRVAGPSANNIVVASCQ